jgi:hypothetical protein
MLSHGGMTGGVDAEKSMIFGILIKETFIDIG